MFAHNRLSFSSRCTGSALFRSAMPRSALCGLCLAFAGILLAATNALAQEKLSGVSDEDYPKIYLGADDLPGMKMVQDSKGMGADKGDKDYVAQGGLRSGLAVWEPAKEGQAVNHINRMVDIRWVFPSAAAAQAYLQNQLPSMAENTPPVKSPPRVGQESYVFGGINEVSAALGDPMRSYIFAFRQDNVVVKFFAAEYAADGQLRPLTMIPMCQKIVERIKAVER
jgi:hypothetical protein